MGSDVIGGSDAFAPPRRLLSRPRYDYRAGSVEGDNTKLRRAGELGLPLILLRNLKGAAVPCRIRLIYPQGTERERGPRSLWTASEIQTPESNIEPWQRQELSRPRPAGVVMRHKRRPIRVAGEPVEALLPGLLAVRDSMVVHDDGTASMEATLPAEQAAPLTRALFRVEAELLQRDARVWDELARTRTSENRRADAFLLLAQRVALAVQRSQDDHPAAS